MHHGGSGAAGGGWVLIIIARYNKPGKTVNPKWFVVHHSSWPKCGTAWAQMIYWETPYPTKHNKRNYRHPRDLHPLYAKASPVGHWGQTHFEITVESIFENWNKCFFRALFRTHLDITLSGKFQKPRLDESECPDLSGMDTHMLSLLNL